MSNTDSFIEEVSEEVRRDRLFLLFRRYGWIAVAVILILVGGAAYREYTIAQRQNEAAALGDSILESLRIEDVQERAASLGEIEATGEAGTVVAFLASALELENDDPNAAAARLEEIATNADLPRRYRELASLKRIMLLSASMPAEERITSLQPLTAPGAPYRVLAEEQIAIAQIDAGQIEAAVERLRLLLEDQDASAALRRRASELIVALGETPQTTQ